MPRRSISDGAFIAMKADYHCQLGRLSSQGMTTRVEQGFFPGRAPLGYRNVTSRSEKSIVLDEDMAPRLCQLFMKAAEGNTSIRHLADFAQQIGLSSRQGKPFSKSSLWKILTNPFYCGLIRYRGKLLPGQHPALISEELFGQVQEALRQRRKE